MCSSEEGAGAENVAVGAGARGLKVATFGVAVGADDVRGLEIEEEVTGVGETAV